MTVHLMVARQPDQIVARCGHARRIRSGEPLPRDEFTGWESQTTCPACRQKDDTP